jgi:hypothetical protein
VGKINSSAFVVSCGEFGIDFGFYAELIPAFESRNELQKRGQNVVN